VTAQRHDVDARTVDGRCESRTPCHQRQVRIERSELDSAHAAVVVCPTCFALWEVSFPLGRTGIALWIA
jgi:hypothetical protein